MDVEFEIRYRDEQIKDLKEGLAGTKREKGAFCREKGNWRINYSSILSKLIQEAGRWCEHYASDLFILWSVIDRRLKDGTLGTESFVFAFRASGVDSENAYKLHQDMNDRNYYRAVWVLDVVVNEDEIEMVLHK